MVGQGVYYYQFTNIFGIDGGYWIGILDLYYIKIKQLYEDLITSNYIIPFIPFIHNIYNC